MKASPRFAELALVFVSMLWGATFVLVKNALDDISPTLFLAIRFSIASVLLALVYVARRGPIRQGWTGGLVAGLFLYTGYFLQTLGLKYTTASKSGFLTGLYIVLVPLIGAVVYQKVPGLSEWMGVSLATLGMGLMTLTSARFEIGAGEALTVGCAFAFAIHMLVLAHYSRRMQTELMALLQIVTCAVISLTTFRFIESAFVRWTPGVLVALLVTSVLATAVAFLLQTWGQKYTTATRAALIFSLEPVFAWLTSYVVEHEVLTGQSLAGAACILAGILLVDLKPLGHRESAEV
jgi:drug/metabolite transporter (DMT)-like permease